MLKTSLVLAYGILTACISLQAETGYNRYNVLFIAVDDLRPDLGCYGVEQSQSPSIDKLAAEGVLFGRHYVQVPTCGASRYSMLTGRSPAKTGITRGNDHFKGLEYASKDPNAATSLPQVFRNSGYKTACIGKISHSPDGKLYNYDGSGSGKPELPNAWDEFATPYGPWGYGWGLFFAYEEGRHREDGKGHNDLMEFTATRDEDLPDGIIAQAAIQQLKKWKDDRFFIGLGFIKPHLPHVATKQDWDAFADVDFEIPSPEKPNSKYWHASNEYFKYNTPFDRVTPLPPEDAANAKHAYYAAVRYVDRQIGKVLEELKTLGLDQNTIVVLWGDHGWHLGEQAIWGKHAPYEETLRSPLIIRVPGGESRTWDGLVESLDIFPTLMELCHPRDTEMAWKLDGESLAAILNGAPEEPARLAYSYWDNVISIRDDDGRLILDKGGKNAPELYTIDANYVSHRVTGDEARKRIEAMLEELKAQKSSPDSQAGLEAAKQVN